MFCQDAPLALMHLLGILLGASMNGGDKTIGGGMKSFVDIVLFKEDVLSSFSR